MSDNLYLDQIEKIEYYKKVISDNYIKRGSLITNLQLQKKIDEIDTRLAVFRQNYIAENDFLDIKKFNEQKADIYADLCILYRVAYKLAKQKLTAVEHRLDCELNELYELAKKYKNKTALESLSIYGNSIYYSTNGFDQEYKDGTVEIDLGTISIPSGSYVACLLESSETEHSNSIFRFEPVNNSKNTETKQIVNYLYGKRYLKIPGDYKIHTHKTNTIEDTTTSFDTGLEANEKSIYNIFAGKQKIKVTDKDHSVTNYVDKVQNIPFTTTSNVDISFYVYNASFIQFDYNNKYSYKSFPGYRIESPKYRQKILISAEPGFSMDVVTDGEIYSDKQSGFITNNKVLCPIGYENVNDFMIEEIAYGDDKEYNTKVIIKNATSTFYDIDYISIKQCQISELDGELE